jgi:hypothetical protein
MEFSTEDWIWVNAIDMENAEGPPAATLVRLSNVLYIKHAAAEKVPDEYKPLCHRYEIRMNGGAKLEVWTRKELPSQMFGHVSRDILLILSGRDPEEEAALAAAALIQRDV